MAIITVSRGTYAGGEQLAVHVGEKLGYKVVSRELLYTRVAELYGFGPDRISSVMEEAPTRRDCFGERQSRRALGESRRRLFVALQASLLQLVKEDNVVYHGLAGHLLFPPVPSLLLRVRLIAPRELRSRMAMAREGLTASEASEKIDRVDAERNRWTRSFYGHAWSDPALFDLVLNLERVTLDEAVEIVVRTAQLPTYQTLPESRTMLGDLALAGHVKALLQAHPDSLDLEVEVEARAGVVRVSGCRSPEEAERIRRIASTAEGVLRLEVAEVER
jgi:cytidylate kinase